MMFGPIDRRDRIVHGVPSRPAIHRTYAALASESDDLSPGRVGSRRQRVTQTRSTSRGFGGTGARPAPRVGTLHALHFTPRASHENKPP